MHDIDSGRGRPHADECQAYYFQYWTLRSVRAVAYAMAGHERHHLADIRRQQGR